ncbi:MAG: redoxin domain-containing protein [Planctomycetes bacterium]|nr:redoxin domain-containing protein [Planctomycetota bacterium]
MQAARWIVIAVVTIGVALLVTFQRGQVLPESGVQGVIGLHSPSKKALDALLEETPSPARTVDSMWYAGGIPHRQAVIHYLSRAALLDPKLLDSSRAIINDACRDADLSVQTIALQLASATGGSAPWQWVNVMLQDADPQVRLLWLNFLVSNRQSEDVSTVLWMLNDSEPQVVATAMAALGDRADRNFAYDPAADKPARRAAVEACLTWWREQKGTQPAAAPALAVPPPPSPTLADEFQLTDIDGAKVDLAALRGRIIVLYFWHSADQPARDQLSELVQLKYRHGDELVVLGIGTDGVSDPHGDAQFAAAADGSLPFNADAARAIEVMARADQVNFPVLIENTGQVAGAYCGFEVPVTVWIGRDGFVRRRYTGTRSLDVLEQIYARLHAISVETTQPTPRP